MKRPCSWVECSEHRVHWGRPDEPRGIQMVEVPDDYPPGDPVHCSMTCGLLNGWLVMKYETYEQTIIRQDEWRKERNSSGQ